LLFANQPTILQESRRTKVADGQFVRWAASLRDEQQACYGALLKGVRILSIDSDQAHRRAEALFKKKEQQAHEGQQAMAEYQAQIDATCEKTARLRALRLARDAANKKTLTAPTKGAA
jgi:hypothetical protein